MGIQAHAAMRLEALLWHMQKNSQADATGAAHLGAAVGWLGAVFSGRGALGGGRRAAGALRGWGSAHNDGGRTAGRDWWR